METAQPRGPGDEESKLASSSQSPLPGYADDGSLRAWLTLAGGFLTTAVTLGYTNAIGVFEDVYINSNMASASNISWIGSTQLFLFFAVSLPAGKLFDMGYLRYTQWVGSIIYSVSLFMSSLSHTDKYYQVFLSQGVGLGIGAGLLYAPAVAVQARHWLKHRALAMTFVVIGSSVGGIIFPIMLNHLIKGKVGFAWGVRASAFVVLASLVVANLLTSDKPIDAEFCKRTSLKLILTDGMYLVFLAGIFFVTWGIFFPDFYLQLYAIMHGVDKNTASTYLSVLNAAGIVGRLVAGALADHVGVFNIMVPVTLITFVILFALVWMKSAISIMVFSITFGLSSCAVFSLMSPCATALSKSPNETGARIGAMFFFSAFAALSGSPIGGALLGPSFVWFRGIVFAAACGIAGFVCLAVTRSMLVRKLGTPLV